MPEQVFGLVLLSLLFLVAAALPVHAVPIFNGTGVWSGGQQIYAQNYDAVWCRGNSTTDDVDAGPRCTVTCSSTTANCGTVIQNSIISLPDGARVLMKRGTYPWNTSITGPMQLYGKDITIEGEYPNTIINFSYNYTTLIRSHYGGFTPDITLQQNKSSMVLKGLVLYGNSNFQGVYNEWNSYVGFDKVDVYDVQFQGAAVGWIGAGTVGYTVDRCYIKDLNLYNTKGFAFDTVQNCVVENPVLYDSDITTASFWFHYADITLNNKQITVINPQIGAPGRVNDTKGFLFENAQDVTIINPYVANVTRAFWHTENNSNIKVIGGRTENVGNGIVTPNGVTLRYAQSITYTGTDISNASSPFSNSEGINLVSVNTGNYSGYFTNLTGQTTVSNFTIGGAVVGTSNFTGTIFTTRQIAVGGAPANDLISIGNATASQGLRVYYQPGTFPSIYGRWFNGGVSGRGLTFSSQSDTAANGGSAGMVWQTGIGVAPTTKMYLNESGLLGIGTVQPSQLLSVNGSGNISNKLYMPGILQLAGHQVCFNVTDSSLFVNTTCP